MKKKSKTLANLKEFEVKEVTPLKAVKLGSLINEAREEKLSNDIWKYQGNSFRAHCKDSALAKKIAGWEDCERSSVYHYPDGHREMDVVFPGRLYNRVAELLKLPLKEKNPNRVAQGRKMSVINKKHRFLRNTRLRKPAPQGAFKGKSLRTSNTLRSEQIRSEPVMNCMKLNCRKLHKSDII